MAVVTSGVRFPKRSYATSFLTAENPISEGSRWTNGLATALDWNNIRVVGGVAYGLQSGTSGLYDDSVALLSGAWGPDQTVTATVHTVNQNSTAFCEVELWVRGTMGAHSITGYESAFRTTHDGSQYIGIVRWNGAIGDFTPLPGGNMTGPGLVDGDTIAVSISGLTISAYVNGSLVGTRTDTGAVIANGRPGFGHWLRLNGATGVSTSDYGLTSFLAID